MPRRAIRAALAAVIMAGCLASSGATLAQASAAPATASTIGAPATPAAADAPAMAATSGTLDATILSIGADHRSIAATIPGVAKTATLAVPKAADEDLLKGARSGDQVKIDVDNAAAPRSIGKIESVERIVSFKTRIVVLLMATVGLFAIVTVVTKGDPRGLLLGVDKRYSNSQTQLALWFGAVAIVYAATTALRITALGWDYIGGVGVPANLIALTGLSALSFGGAKVAGAQQAAKAAAAQNTAQATAVLTNAPGPLPVNAALDQSAATPTKAVTPDAPNLLRDLFQNDAGEPDLGDVQMMLIAVGTVVIFGLASFQFLGHLALAGTIKLVDVDSTLLSGFGVGQGAYLLKKVASPLGKG